MDSEKRRRLLKLAGTSLATIGLTGGIFVASTVGTQAITPNVQAQWEHFAECLGWMLTDPDLHQANCSPGYYPEYDGATKLGGERRMMTGGLVTTTLTETVTQTGSNTITRTVTGSGTTTSSGTVTITQTVTTTIYPE